MLAQLVAGQHGMVIQSQALDAGLTEKQYRTRREDRLLVPVHRGITRHAAVPLTWKGRLVAAVLAGGADAAASHRSAARLEDLCGVPRWRPEVTTCATDLPRAGGVHFHRTNRLDAVDIVVIDGIRTTSIPRTLLDLGAVLPYEMVEVAVQDAVIRNLVTHAQLFAVLERVGGRGRRGTAALRAVMHQAVPDERIESELERRLIELLPMGHGLELQYELRCDDGRQVRLDTACPERKIAIEANGRRWHSTSAATKRDMVRRRSITASGWDHYEYGWSDVTENPESTRGQLAAILAA